MDNNKDKEGILKKIKDWIKGHKAVVASVAAGIIILIAVIICVSNRKKAADDKEKEGELYYSFSDVQKDIGYLAENDDQLERLNRLVDPMKKSNHIDRDYIDSVSDILGIDKKGYKDILKGYSDKNKIPRQVFDRFYNTVVKDEHISGISTVDIFVKNGEAVPGATIPWMAFGALLTPTPPPWFVYWQSWPQSARYSSMSSFSPSIWSEMASMVKDAFDRNSFAMARTGSGSSPGTAFLLWNWSMVRDSA